MASITYLPSEHINNSYRYVPSDDHIRIITNQGCYSQYNTTYCNCYDIYPNYDYITSGTSSCNINVSYVDSTQFNSDWHYRIDAPNIILYASFYIVLTIFILFTLLKVFRKAIRL